MCQCVLWDPAFILFKIITHNKKLKWTKGFFHLWKPRNECYYSLCFEIVFHFKTASHCINWIAKQISIQLTHHGAGCFEMKHESSPNTALCFTRVFSMHFLAVLVVNCFSFLNYSSTVWWTTLEIQQLWGNISF